MEIYLLGTNHKSADVSFREKMALSPEQIPDRLRALQALPGIQEALIVSTCNRTEIYGVSNSPKDVLAEIELFLAESSGVAVEEQKDRFYRRIGKEAIWHLFEVVSGLDSMILGEPQILGQVKDAYRTAHETGTTGVFLNRLLNNSFTVGKRVRSETAIGAGAVSVAYAAVELAQKIFRDLSSRRVLLIGAGETGELTARHLREKGIGTLYIANRTRQKAEQLAAALEGKTVEFSQMQTVFAEADIIIGAAAAPDFLIKRPDLEMHLAKRGARPLFMIDIGVPRNFAPDINRLESVFLHDIDALQQIVESNLKKRRLEIPRAHEILREELGNFSEWKQGLQITPTIISLRKKFEEIRSMELDKYKNKMNEDEYRKMEVISRAILNKVLHAPMVELKKYGNGHPEGMRRIDVVRELFGLEGEE